MEIRTFTFEGHYHDKEGGPRTDIIRAYTREQAIALAALEIISDNGWDDDPDRFSSYESLEEWHDDEIVIDGEWEDLKGTACPNCTSHGGRDTQIEHGGGTIHECSACKFQWVPLGHAIQLVPTSEEIDEQIRAAWAELKGEPWSCANCGNTDQDGSDECVDCGQAMETQE